MKEGRMEGRKEGRKERRKEGGKEGRKEGVDKGGRGLRIRNTLQDDYFCTYRELYN